MAQDVVITDASGTEHVFPPGFDPKRAAAIVAKAVAPPAPASTSKLDQMLALLPTAGGAIGGIAGGLPGAMLGGAAGNGYQQLATHARELPGAAADVASNLLHEPVATLKGAASGAMQGAKDAGIDGAIQGLYELGGQAVTGALKYGGRAVYRGYLKPSLSQQLAPRAKEIVETGIREWIPVTADGAAHAERLATELRTEVDRILSTAKGEVNLSDVANQVRAFARRHYYLPGKPTADYEAAMKVAEELDQHPSLANPFAPTSPATTNLPGANTIKRGLDESVGEANFGVDRGATKTTQKVARHGVRQAIEAKAPSVGPLNDRERKLIDLTDALNRTTGREGNRNQLFGAPSLIAAGAGMSEVAHGASRYGSAAVALATRIGLSPVVASQAAIIAARLGDAMPGTAVADIARAAVAAAQASSKPEQQP